jgi:hypothetical protein
MEKIEYKILQKNILRLKLVSLTSQNWYDYNDNLIPWSGYTGLTPNDGDIVFNTNITDELIEANYRWSGLTWNLVTGSTEEINEIIYNSHDIPVFLNNTIKNLGIMIEFDGNISQIDEICNFTYSGKSRTIKVFNTVNLNKIGTLIDSVFTIGWGDGTYSTLPMTKINDANLSYKSHIYINNGTYILTITIDSPWKVNKIEKTIVIPFPTTFEYPIDLGTLTFSVPYADSGTTVDQTYIENYPSTTGQTNSTIIYFFGIGKSRVDELKKYGRSGAYSGLTITTGYTGYTLDGLYYMDNIDGFTYISGNTSGTIEAFYNDEIYNGMITRNEYFLGFIDEPIIYSDVFIDRGKMSIMERNFRLSEIDNIGELEIYGNGFFNVKKQ